MSFCLALSHHWANVFLPVPNHNANRGWKCRQGFTPALKETGNLHHRPSDKASCCLVKSLRDCWIIVMPICSSSSRFPVPLWLAVHLFLELLPLSARLLLREKCYVFDQTAPSGVQFFARNFTYQKWMLRHLHHFKLPQGVELDCNLWVVAGKCPEVVSEVADF